jgi:hypothetical protein
MSYSLSLNAASIRDKDCTSRMTLESLPNEVCLETFEYLNLGDIFQAFYDLN